MDELSPIGTHVEDRLRSLENKVSDIHEVVIELKTMIQSPHPIRDEIAEAHDRIHKLEVCAALSSATDKQLTERQDTLETQVIEKITATASTIYENKSNELFRKVVALVTAISVVFTLLNSFVTLRIESMATKTIERVER